MSDTKAENLFVGALIGVIALMALFSIDSAVYKLVVVTLVVGPAVPVIVAMALVFLWARRKHRPSLGALAAAVIALLGYAVVGRWVGAYGLGLAMVTREVNARCAVRLMVRDPSELTHFNFEPGPIRLPRICNDIHD